MLGTLYYYPAMNASKKTKKRRFAACFLRKSVVLKALYAFFFLRSSHSALSLWLMSTDSPVSKSIRYCIISLQFTV